MQWRLFRALPNDNAPLSVAQLVALARVASRELTWCLPGCAAEVRRWRRRAAAIPDPPLRIDAIEGLTYKRPHLDGAALFATLSRRRDAGLLRALVVYEAILEYLDNANERAVDGGVRNGLQLHRALIDGLDPRRGYCDYYRYHGWRQDCGYLGALVAACQQACGSLPAYRAVRGQLVEQACLAAQVLALNHEPDAARRERLLRAWAGRQADSGIRPWYEIAGAATGSLCVHALLVLAGERALSGAEWPDAVRRVVDVYPRLSLAATMLDSYGDQVQDAADGRHSYVGYHGDLRRATEGLSDLIGECLTVACRLPSARQTIVLIASMVALYLSSDSSRGPVLHESTRVLLRSGGSLTLVLAPVLRAWRIAYGLTSA